MMLYNRHYYIETSNISSERDEIQELQNKTNSENIEFLTNKRKILVLFVFALGVLRGGVGVCVAGGFGVQFGKFFWLDRCHVNLVMNTHVNPDGNGIQSQIAKRRVHVRAVIPCSTVYDMI